MLIGSRASLLLHLDVRADGGYIVAPPSRHPAAGQYTWETPLSAFPPAPLPDAVLSLLLTEAG